MQSKRRLSVGLVVAVASIVFSCGGDRDASGDALGGESLPNAGSGSERQPSVSDAAPARPLCDVPPSNAPLTIATDRGLVHGTRSAGADAYFAIPYSTAPIGTRRFAPPDEGACWSGVREATAFGATCAQSGGTGSEDCLTLNVWTPSARGADASLPVLFWIHGGSNVTGGSNQTFGLGSVYDGRALAEAQNVVVVTFNYRLGALGFLAHASLSAESPNRASGNYGLLDAISALKWVQRNAKAFGGDPARVMVFGQSAGAVNTCMLVASPLARGLFSSALMESGWCETPTLALRYRQAEGVVKAAGCSAAADVPACLRSAPVERVLQAQGSVSVNLGSGSPTLTAPSVYHDQNYGPNVDGYVLPDAPLKLFAQGKHNKVPVVAGSNAREAALFIPPGTVASCGAYATVVRAAFGALAPRLESLYPCDVFDLGSPHRQLVAIFTDVAVACPTRRALRALATGQTAPVRRFLYNHGLDSGPLAPLGPAHSAELPFVWNGFAPIAYSPTPREVALSSLIRGYWSAFAAKGDPNFEGAFPWPAYDARRDNAIELDASPSAVASIQAAQCDFWDSRE